MSELEETADHLVVIGRGRLIADTSVSDLVARASDGSMTIRTPDHGEVMVVLAQAGATVTSTGHDTVTVSGLAPEMAADLVAGRGLRLHELSPHRASLEEAYIQLTRSATDYAGQPGVEVQG